jgi:hypothetical protein
MGNTGMAGQIEEEVAGKIIVLAEALFVDQDRWQRADMIRVT